MSIIDPTQPGKRCNCALCNRLRHTQDVIESRNVDRLIELVNQLENQMVNVEMDLDYRRCILNGSWPSSVAILRHALAKAEASEVASA